jgi:DNA-3-methyladenine glycosylase I
MTGTGMAEFGADGIRRCPWGVSVAEYREYHDTEWGRPVDQDERVLEQLCLEGFQGGLSRLTILRKRAAFRRAFAGFDPVLLAEFTEDDLARLLRDPAIVRHRGKITATVGNARAVLRLWERGISLAGLVWSFEAPRRRPPRSVAASTPESEALARELRRLGFRFIGPASAYAAMQALGIVNDHLDGCDFWAVCDAMQRAFARPAAEFRRWPG